jgi:hypothetical protein
MYRERYDAARMAPVRIVRDDDEVLVVRVRIGSFWQIAGRVSLLIVFVLLALGVLGFFVLGRSRTLTCHREPAVCELRDKGIVDDETETIPRDQVVSVEVEQSLGKCRTKLRTQRALRLLNPIWTARCIEHRKNAATINAFLAAPSEPPVVVRFDEKVMFVMSNVMNFGGAACFLFFTFWPTHLTLRVDRRRRSFTFRKWPWRRESRVVPIARVKELSMENIASSHLRVELVLDDSSSVIARTHEPVDPILLSTVSERILAALAVGKSV